MKSQTIGRALLMSVMSAALAWLCPPSFAQQPTTGGGSPGMGRTPGGEGAAGVAGASAPPGMTAAPAPDDGASTPALRHHKKHGKSHRHRRHATAAQAASTTKP